MTHQNHDLDFGIPQYKYLTSQCHFPWLLANVFEPDGKTLLADSKPTHMLTSSNGIKIGLIGIAEQEWLATVNALPPNLPYVSATETVLKYAPQLREQGAEIIICLCHQREVHDNRLAASLPEGTIDLILAGHDHHYRYSKINGTHIVCSGSDFKNLSYIEARRTSHRAWDVTITRRNVNKSIPEDAPTLSLMNTLFSSFRAKLEKPIGYTAAPLDARFETVRAKESNYGNFVADLVRTHYDADCAMIVGGTIRGDQVYPPGVLRIKDIVDCFPFEDPTVLISVLGSDLRAALENGVSMYPALEGRFAHVSNMTYSFDPSKAPGSRLVEVTLGGAPLDDGKEYSLVTRDYTVQGGDGFASLRAIEHGGRTKYIIDEENGALLSTLLRQYFMSLKVLGRWKNWSGAMGRHWSGVQDGLHATHPVREPLSTVEKDSTETAKETNTNDPHPRKPQGADVPGLIGQALRNDNAHASKKQKRPPKEDEGVDHPGLSDSEDDDTDLPAAPRGTDRERELVLMRRVVRKWWRLAGLTGHPSLCDDADDDEGVRWTRGICPRVEGRIRIIGVTK